MTLRELRTSIADDLEVELKDMPTYSRELLDIKVNDAIRDVMDKRGYASAGYSPDMIEDDIERYIPQIKALAQYDYLIIGASGESYHYEGGTNRTWIDRRRLYNGIIPLAKVF